MMTDMMNKKEWALVQRYPVHKRIPQESPLYCNTEFAYTTKGREHAQAFKGYFQVPVITNTEKAETITNSVIQPFDKMPTLSSEIPVCELEEDLVIELDDKSAIETNSKQTDDHQEDLIDLTGELYTEDELILLADTELLDLWENLIPKEELTVLGGDSDVGKSLLYMQLCHAIIDGKKEFLGLPLNPRYNATLIINSEDSPRSVGKRLKKQLSGRSLPLNPLHRIYLLSTSKSTPEKIESFLKKHPVDLVVIDALGDVFEGDLNSSISTRTFLDKFMEIAQKNGCAILFVHHTSKGPESRSVNKDNMLGSVGIHGKARSVLMMSKSRSDSNIKFLRIVKGNNVSEEAKNKNIVLEFDPNTLLHKVVADESLKEKAVMQFEKLKMPKSSKRAKTDLLMEKTVKMTT
jgi:RecA-family ATPase